MRRNAFGSWLNGRSGIGGVPAALVTMLASLGGSAFGQCQYESHGWSPFPCGAPFFTVYTGSGLNDLGAWCGYRLGCTTETNFPVYCPPGGMPQVLPMPPGASAGGAQATAVNNAGVVVGFKYVGQFDEYRQGVIWWPDGSVETIPPVAGSNNSRANDINSSGVIVGSSGGLPYVLENGLMESVPSPGPGGGSALRISSSGFVLCNFGSLSTDNRACRWRDGGLTVLDPIDGQLVSIGYGINSAGEVVGSSMTYVGGSQGYSQTPTLWRIDRAIELPKPPGYINGYAISINDSGVITGRMFATDSGLPQIYVLWIDGAVFPINSLTVPGSPQIGPLTRLNAIGQILASGGPRLLTPTWWSPADLNGDCAVNGSDLGVLLASWGAPDFDPRCDFNGDGIVDGHDLGTLLGAWTVN